MYSNASIQKPYIIVEDGRPKVTDKHIQELKYRTRFFRDFIRDGLIEYLDVNEINECHIAVYEKDIKPFTTHLEIEPYTWLGVCAGLIPYINHNFAEMSIFQCAAVKYAFGNVGLNQGVRMDSLTHNLVYSQQPIVKSKTSRLIKSDQLPAGHNAIVAVANFGGYNAKNAIVINRAAVDRGFGRSLFYKVSKIVLKKDCNGNKEYLEKPKIDGKSEKEIWKYKLLDSDGIAPLGVMVENQQVLMNKVVPTVKNALSTDAELLNDRDDKNFPIIHKGILPSFVERVMVAPNAEESTLLKILMRQTRRPEVGDKFCNQHGQKGIVGYIAEPEDLPFTHDGIIPDIIINSHRFSSDRVVGPLKETLAAKVGAVTGQYKNGTAFSGDKVEDIMEDLIKCGFNYDGKDCMTSGMTGETIDAYIFIGPLYYFKLQHMVVDKIHARARGAKTDLTRQPLEGRDRNGGLRLGERERDCLIGHGASMVLYERLMLASDTFSVDVCGKCGLMGYSNWCHFCRSSTNIATIRIPYACKLLFQELQSMNVIPRLKLTNYFN